MLLLLSVLLPGSDNIGTGINSGIKFEAPKEVRDNWIWKTKNDASISEKEMAAVKLSVIAYIKEKYNINNVDCHVEVSPPLGKRRVPGEKAPEVAIKFVISVCEITEYNGSNALINWNALTFKLDEKLQIIK